MTKRKAQKIPRDRIFHILRFVLAEVITISVIDKSLRPVRVYPRLVLDNLLIRQLHNIIEFR
jgi:hypothetical protein